MKAWFVRRHSQINKVGKTVRTFGRKMSPNARLIALLDHGDARCCATGPCLSLNLMLPNDLLLLRHPTNLRHRLLHTALALFYGFGSAMKLEHTDTSKLG